MNKTALLYGVAGQRPLRFCDFRRSGAVVAIGIQPAPIPELITAEGTVVEGKSKNAKQAAQRVAARAVDFILPAEYIQLAVVAKRTLTPALEDGDERPVESRIFAAVAASVRGACDDLEYQAPRAAPSSPPAFKTNRHL
jgi:hypothetical protein